MRVNILQLVPGKRAKGNPADAFAALLTSSRRAANELGLGLTEFEERDTYWTGEVSRVRITEPLLKGKVGERPSQIPCLPDEGPARVTAFAIDPGNRLIAVQGGGVGGSTLVKFLRLLTPLKDPLAGMQALHIVNRDDSLPKNATVRKVSIRLAPGGFPEEAKTKPGLQEGLDRLERLQTGSINLTLTATRSRKGEPLAGLKVALDELAEVASWSSAKTVKAFVLDDDENDVELVDFLTHRLYRTVELHAGGDRLIPFRTRSRAICAVLDGLNGRS